MKRIVKLHQTDKHILKQKPNFKLNKQTKFSLNSKLLRVKCGFILKAVKLYNKTRT